MLALRCALSFGSDAAMRKVFPRPPSRETAAARAVLTRSPVMIPDVMEDPEFRIGFTAATTGFRSIVAIPRHACTGTASGTAAG